MLPEKTKRKSSAKFRSYDIINRGEIKLPNGTELMTFSWSGTFPGASRKGASYIKTQHWKSPKELERIFDGWRKNGTVLILMVTETFINHEVMLSEFISTPQGGNGDIGYDVAFIENKDIQVYTTSELNIKPSAKTNTTSSSVRAAPAAASAKTYTVVKGDSLWAISKKFLGSGARYTEVYNLNKGVIGGNPNLIYPGQVLTLPS